MRKRKVFFGLQIGLLLVSSNLLSNTFQEDEGGRAGLAKAVAGAKASLEQGLATVSRDGKPLSAKFEIEDGRLQLSVYRVKGDQFAEVILDANTAAVYEVDQITSGSDYNVAQDQNAAMAKAKRSLQAVLTQVLKGNSGFRAVSIVPSLKDGHPVAQVALTKGDEWKTTLEKLD